MKQRADCKAYQVSDQMTCPSCRLTWDVNDPEPPMCRLGEEPENLVAQDAVERGGKRPLMAKDRQRAAEKGYRRYKGHKLYG